MRIGKTSAIVSSFLLVLLAIISMAFVAACSGGSRGTGGLAVEGSVSRASDGEPISDANVAVANSENQSITDGQGQFVLSLDQSVNQIELVISTDNITSSIVIGNIPDGAVVVFVEITLDTQTGVASSSNIEFVSNSDTNSNQSNSNSNESQNANSNNEFDNSNDNSSSSDDDSDNSNDSSGSNSNSSGSGGGSSDDDDNDNNSGSGKDDDDPDEDNSGSGSSKDDSDDNDNS